MTANSESLLGALAAFTASVTWAFAATQYAEASRSAGAVRVNLLRAVLAASLWLTALVLFEGPAALAGVDLRHALFLAGSITCSYALGDGVFFAAASRLGVSSALAIAAIYPLWAALYGVLFRGEPFGWLRAAGLFACLAGVVAILLQTRAPSAGRVDTKQHAALWGVGLALLTSLFWAGNAVFLKLGAAGLSLYQTNAVRFSFGSLLLLAQLLRSRAQQPLAERQGAAGLARRLRLPLLVDTGLGSLAFVYGIAHTDLALGATLSSLSPLVALPIAASLGSERVSLGKGIAVAVTVLGVVLLVAAPA